ncbi:MAG: DUF4911 domain-containing protein [Desulfobacterales bacterium]|nr:DUF4911 domain-containing protein [Desulfobacterales bacterium]
MIHAERDNDLRTVEQYYRVERSGISFLKFILEAYDGIAVLTTIDPVSGQIILKISPGCEPEVEMILDDLKKKMMIEQIKKEEE